MSEVQLVHAYELKTIEDYAEHLLSACMQLNTLMLFQDTSQKKGMLDEDEHGVSELIKQNLKKAQKVYQSQIYNICERNNIDQKKVVADFMLKNHDIVIHIKKRAKRKKKEPECIITNT